LPQEKTISSTVTDQDVLPLPGVKNIPSRRKLQQGNPNPDFDGLLQLLTQFGGNFWCFSPK